MSIIEKNAAAQLKTATQDIYTVPASTTSRVLMARITNKDGTNASDATVQWVDADGPGITNISSWDLVNALSQKEVVTGDTTQETNGTVELFVDPSSYNVYLASANTSAVYQYYMSIPGDITSLTFAGKFFYTGNEVSSTQTASLSYDGLKLYVLDGSDEAIYQYTLSTAWDISTASYDSVSYDPTEISNASSLKFKSDGTEMYVLDAANDYIHQYTLSTAWDISTASHSGNSFSTTAEDSSMTSMAFSDDGTKLYAAGNSNIDIFQYTLSTAWDISTASYDSVFLSVNTTIGSNLGMHVSSDDTKFWAADSNGIVYTIHLDSSGDLSHVEYYTVDLPGSVSLAHSIAFSPDGLKLCAYDDNQNNFYNFNLLTPWDVSSAVAVSNTSGSFNGYGNFCFGDSGSKLFITSKSENIVQGYHIVGDPYAPESLSTYDNVSVGDSNEAVFFKPDGLKMFTVDSTTSPQTIDEWNLTEAWDLSTATSGVDFDVSTQTTTPTDVAINNDGTVMWVLEDTTRDIFQYTLSTPWDISTASYDSVSFDVLSTASSLFVNPDGNQFFTSHPGAARISRFSIRDNLSDLSVHALTYEEEVAAGESTSIHPGGLILEEGDKIQAYSSSNYDLDITLAIQEIS